MLMSFSGFCNSASNDDIFNTSHKVSTAKNSTNDSSQFIIEENENENENDFAAAQLIVTPFLFSYFQVSSFQILHFFQLSFTGKTANPIYLSICNFRI